ncbi:hypothetical protein [Rhodococcus sp. BH5]|uniref:hypothetical protein n=1 Tax=Rhodococcus sp. BH5 TaxID=2871702 RepID=UPI0022CDAEBD|nr:hypothetical protein [Rhodococcus sp. BH5]MCZ9634731.1 hypothetical protein [Rhodococcus sp. BH5]
MADLIVKDSFGEIHAFPGAIAKVDPDGGTNNLEIYPAAGGEWIACFQEGQWVSWRSDA